MIIYHNKQNNLEIFNANLNKVNQSATVSDESITDVVDEKFEMPFNYQ